MDAALAVRSEACVPKGARQKIFPKTVQQRRAALRVADQVPLVREIQFLGVFLQQRGQGEAGLDAEPAPLVEEAQGIGCLVSGQ